jgi:hypothetical protein
MLLRRKQLVAAAAFAAPLLAALALAPRLAAATPLEPQACTALKTERQGLIADGVKTDMGKGADWAKANLPAERLGKIERLIAVEEQLSFRCDDLVTARPQMKEPPKPAAKAQADESDKQAGDSASATADGSGAAPQKPTRKSKTVSKTRKPKKDAVD